MTVQCAWCIAKGRIEPIPGASHTICEECLAEDYPEDEETQSD